MIHKKYMCILRSKTCSMDKPSVSDTDAMYAAYEHWQAKFARNILDIGGALSQHGALVTKDGVEDSSVDEPQEVIAGYMLLTADSLETAIVVMKESPMLKNASNSLEIREIHTPS